MTSTPHVGQLSTTNENFTRMLCEKLKWPVPVRKPGETDDTFLARRVEHLKVYSPQWASVDLTKLSHDELELAASQICNAAADYGQTQIAERLARERLPSTR
jgi:hypothetical protein